MSTCDAHDALSDTFFEARKAELEGRLKPARFAHALGVMHAAQELARTYGVDERAARLAGLLHDWDKNYDDEGIRQRAEELGLVVDPYVFQDMPRLLHGPTAAAALVREFPSLPHEVVQAIERHTAGAPNMTDLDMIVYVSDALEPGRDYPGIQALRDLVERVPLEELFLKTFQHVLLNLVERCKNIHPQTLEVWNYYVDRARERASATKSKKEGKA